MSLPRISHYQASWSLATGTGKIVLTFVTSPNPAPVQIEGLDANTFHALHMLLLNEHPMFWDASTGTLTSGAEPVGEEERD